MGMEGAGGRVGGGGVGSAGALLQDSSEEPYPVASSHKWVLSEYAFLSHYCKITPWFYLWAITSENELTQVPSGEALHF